MTTNQRQADIAELRALAITLRTWRAAYHAFDLKITYERDRYGYGERGFSCARYGAYPVEEEGASLFQIEVYTHWGGGWHEPSSVDADDTDDEPCDLDAALRRVLELEIEDAIHERLSDQAQYEHWKQDMRSGEVRNHLSKKPDASGGEG